MSNNTTKSKTMAEPARISNRRIRQDGMHASGHKLYHCGEKSEYFWPGCECGGAPKKKLLHKIKNNPTATYKLEACEGGDRCKKCLQCKYPLALFAPHSIIAVINSLLVSRLYLKGLGIVSWMFYLGRSKQRSSEGVQRPYKAKVTPPKPLSKLLQEESKAVIDQRRTIKQAICC